MLLEGWKQDGNPCDVRVQFMNLCTNLSVCSGGFCNVAPGVMETIYWVYILLRFGHSLYAQ